jgi:NAD(P)-dependent dehydrogenase (short-subunit alcohol dehydrogenase family)
MGYNTREGELLMLETRSLSGRTALVTGGGRGIGRAIALSFAQEGAAVAVAARTIAEIKEVAACCRAYGVQAAEVRLDVANRGSCERAVAWCEEEWGHLDILVNNAGIASAQKFTDIDDDLWEHTLRVNLTGPFFTTRAALPGMLHRHDGAVIAVDSIAGKIGGSYIAPYSASKHGLLGMMRSLAAEYAHSGITFNCVCPAYVDTPMTSQSIAHIMKHTARTYEQALQALLTPEGRLIKPEEVAAVCVWLAGPEGRSVNGQAINVDGGQVQS